jgi:hypothetical protein
MKHLSQFHAHRSTVLSFNELSTSSFDKRRIRSNWLKYSSVVTRLYNIGSTPRRVSREHNGAFQALVYNEELWK